MRKTQKSSIEFGFALLASALLAVGCQTTRLPTAIRSADNASLLVQVSEDPGSLMWNEGRPKNIEKLALSSSGQSKNALDAKTLQTKAELLLVGHMSRDAAEQARTILKRDLRNVRALKTLIKAALMERRPHEALALTGNATSLSGADAELYSYEGLAQFQLNNPLYAKALWNKALSLNPNHIPTLMNMGVVLFQNGHSKKAGALFDRVLAIQPQHLDAQVGRALVMSSEGQSEEAVATLDEVLRRTGDNALVLENLANISRERLKDYKRAARYVDRTLAMGKVDRKTIETAVGMKQELRRLIAAQEKNLSDENLREMASRSAQSTAGASGENAAAETNSAPSELQKMEDSIK
ncbi:MAG: tetratricopeptide repeat protein [Silvanigrellaceae bacterium]